MNVCSCPLGNFPTTEDVVCKKSFGQIQKVIFCDLRYFSRTPEPLLTGEQTEEVIQQGGSSQSFLDSAIYSGLIFGLPAIIKPGDHDTAYDFLASVFGDYVWLFKYLAASSDVENEWGLQVDDYVGGSLCVVSPLIEAPAQEPGEFRVFGGGNETKNGIERYLGIGPSEFSGVMRGVPQSVIKKLKQIECLAEKGHVGVVLINGNDEMEVIDDGRDVYVTWSGTGQGGNSSIAAYRPIPIRSLRISDKIHGGYDNMDYNEISWRFLPNYSDNLVIVGGEFCKGLSSIKIG